MNKQSSWSKSHINAHFAPTPRATVKQTWLTRALKWLRNVPQERQLTLIRPGNASARCTTADELFNLSQIWHGPEGEVIYHFGKRSCVRVAPTKMPHRETNLTRTKSDRDLVDSKPPQPLDRAPSRSAGLRNGSPRPSRWAINELLEKIAAQVHVPPDTDAANRHDNVFKGETIADLESMVARTERRISNKENQSHA